MRAPRDTGVALLTLSLLYSQLAPGPGLVPSSPLKPHSQLQGCRDLVCLCLRQLLSFSLSPTHMGTPISACPGSHHRPLAQPWTAHWAGTGGSRLVGELHPRPTA